jgi:hypothetical protein
MWGEPAEIAVSVPRAPTDQALHRHINSCRPGPISEVGLVGGDLARTAGGGTAPTLSGVVTRCLFDVVRVDLSGGRVGQRTLWAGAHVIARETWLRGSIVMAMQAQFFGPYDVAPRGHPNDGKVDVVEVDAAMPWRDRLQARQRARLGTHLPHPQISARQMNHCTLTFADPRVVWVDGVRVGTATEMILTVEPDAFTGYV